MVIGFSWVHQNKENLELKINNMNINFIGKRNINFVISGVLFLVAVFFLVTYGLKPGMDFTGGSLMEVSFTEALPEVSQVREVVQSMDLGTPVVQTTDNNGIIIKTKFLTEAEHQNVLSELRTKFETDNNKVLEQRVETVGSSISATLRNRSFTAIIIVCLAIITFIAYAFRKVSRPVASWKFGTVAVIALIHDVTITAGVFAVLGKFLDIEVDTAFVVALLTVLGYSVNDTIVVFDRVRENLIKHSVDDFPGLVNKSINDTLARSLNTTLTTLLALAALFFFGGATIKNFSLALLVGIFLGAYSSIFVASPLLVVWQKWDEKRHSR